MNAAYRSGVELFRGGAYFEAHEVLEEVWRATPVGDRRQFLQGLIQLAVSLEHWRRGNARGAAGQWAKAFAKLEGLPARFDGLELGELLASFHAFFEARDLPRWVAAQAAGEALPPEPGPYPTPRWSRAETLPSVDAAAGVPGSGGALDSGGGSDSGG